MHRLLIQFFIALAACACAVTTISAADVPPTGGRAAGTATRLVVLVRERERALLDAIGKNDLAALSGVLAEDFTQYSLTRGMLPTPRADWLRNLAARPFGKVRFDDMSTIDHGAALVANFDLQISDAKNAVQHFGVVDVWTKAPGAADWTLSQRYIATSATKAPVPGDNVPDAATPPKRI